MSASVHRTGREQAGLWSQLAGRLRSVSLTVVAVGVVGIAMVVAAWINIQAEEAGRQAVRSVDIRERTERFLVSMLDAETGQRGFLLTGDDRYLEPYERGRANALPDLANIQSLVEGNAEQRARVERLRQLADRKLQELDETARLMRANRRDEAVALVRQGVGRNTMDELRDMVSAVQEEESRLIEERNRLESRRRIKASIGILIALAGLSFIAWRQIRLRSRRNVLLSTSNSELEQRVAERTAQLENERLRIESLLRDVNHRVGNNLSMVSALLSVQSRQSRDPAVKAALGQAQSRIQAIAAGQRRLRLDIEADEIEARPYIEDLLAEIGKQVEGRPITVALEMDPIRLAGRDAVSFVVLLNELVTNAIKHAFPDGMAGCITIRLAEDPAEATLLLSVEDDGVGMPAEKAVEGLGQSVIRNLLRSMRATMETTAPAAGTGRPGTCIALRIPKRPPQSEDGQASA